MSRLLTLLLMYRSGYDVGKYVSIEKEIERTKETYYEALAASSQGWREGKGDYAPFVTYMLGIIDACYRGLANRLPLVGAPADNEEAIRAFFDRLIGSATKREILDANPGMSQRTLERILSKLQQRARQQAPSRGRPRGQRGGYSRLLRPVDRLGHKAGNPGRQPGDEPAHAGAHPLEAAAGRRDREDRRRAINRISAVLRRSKRRGRDATEGRYEADRANVPVRPLDLDARLLRPVDRLGHKAGNPGRQPGDEPAHAGAHPLEAAAGRRDREDRRRTFDRISAVLRRHNAVGVTQREVATRPTAPTCPRARSTSTPPEQVAESAARCCGQRSRDGRCRTH